MKFHKRLLCNGDNGNLHISENRKLHTFMVVKLVVKLDNKVGSN